MRIGFYNSSAAEVTFAASNRKRDQRATPALMIRLFLVPNLECSLLTGE